MKCSCQREPVLSTAITWDPSNSFSLCIIIHSHTGSRRWWLASKETSTNVLLQTTDAFKTDTSHTLIMHKTTVPGLSLELVRTASCPPFDGDDCESDFISSLGLFVIAIAIDFVSLTLTMPLQLYSDVWDGGVQLHRKVSSKPSVDDAFRMDTNRTVN
jgi:hypothetical protein